MEENIFSNAELTIIVSKIQQEMQEYRRLQARVKANNSNYEVWLSKTQNYFKSSVDKKVKRIEEYKATLTELEIEIDQLKKKTKRYLVKVEKLQLED